MVPLFFLHEKAVYRLCKRLIIKSGEYRSRTDDLLHAMLLSRLFFTFCSLLNYC